MSHTQSRGIYRPKHWHAAAVAVEAGLHARYGKTWEATKYPIGALASIGRLFYWALEGLKQAAGEETHSKMPSMAGTACVRTVTAVMEGMGRKATSRNIGKLALGHHDLIRRIQQNYLITGSDAERRRLRQFLQKLIELGES
ncbi:hypothetical protein KW800_02555 [Candidatus Parcubacteria bacterium]|nr:hypothetical protein [Candidatus Parcubacteria bacterium]